MNSKSILDGFIAPKSMAILGASNNTLKPGGKIVENIVSQGYTGEIFLINPKSQEVQGRPALASINDLPYAPDLVFIAIPAPHVKGALEDLARLGVKRVIILSAGFSEVSEEGRQVEEQLARIANQNQMVILGPNCLGVTSPFHAGKFAGLLPEMKQGGIDFISGSGATVDMLAEQATRRGLVFHTFFTVGNSAQMDVTEVLGLMDREHNEKSSKHLMLYLEKIKNPKKLVEHARSLALKGCVLMAVKSGVTEAGRRAAASHTGAMAADDTAVQAMFDKAGFIRLQSKLDLVDTATALTQAKGRYNGRRACMITDAGGPGVMAADELNRQGIELPRLKPETRRKLAELLPLGAGINNPIDFLPTRTPEQVTQTLEIIAQDEADTIDYILFQVGAPGFTDNWPVYQAVIQAVDTLDLPIFVSYATAVSSARDLSRYLAAGKCHFDDEVSMARAVGRMVNRPRIFIPGPDPKGFDGKKAAHILKDVSGVVPPETVRLLLQAAGIPEPWEMALKTKDDLTKLESFAPAPWAFKVQGPLHKTDLGGVALGIGPDSAGETFDRLMKIKGARGVAVQEMVQGPEVIMGLSRDDKFGHLVAFGLGGVLAEALGDVQFRLAPLAREEARLMIESIRALPVLKGFRGQPGLDLDVLANLLVRVSLLARDVPAIKEMDINPVKGVGRNLSAVDVRIIMG